jgi:hypothetical protein
MQSKDANLSRRTMLLRAVSLPVAASLPAALTLAPAPAFALTAPPTEPIGSAEPEPGQNTVAPSCSHIATPRSVSGNSWMRPD